MLRVVQLEPTALVAASVSGERFVSLRRTQHANSQIFRDQGRKAFSRRL